MIVPSIDVMGGRAVQLRHGRELVLDGGDPLARIEEFGVAGEVAVVDLDAALGRGSNTELIRAMIRVAPCRVGGGIRSLDAARAWLDAGARKVMLGTAATPELCGQLPRERVIAAVDAVQGAVVVDGWRQASGETAADSIARLAPHVGGILLTQVEHEGAMAGFDLAAVSRAVAAAGSARVTAAGGITTSAQIAELDALGADGQVGMAVYTGRLSLGEAIAAPLRVGAGTAEIWPTVVCDELGGALGLAWSTRESVERAVAMRRGVYWSRSRDALWVKGEISGNLQELVRVDLDCDRDALRFMVRQRGTGFCHSHASRAGPTCSIWATSSASSGHGESGRRRSRGRSDCSRTARCSARSSAKRPPSWRRPGPRPRRYTKRRTCSTWRWSRWRAPAAPSPTSWRSSNGGTSC